MTKHQHEQIEGSDRDTNGEECGSGNATNRKRKYACVECRQQKSKCDYNELLPQPCSRCSKKNIECVIKKDFRRTSKRARANAIERKVNQLTTHLLNGSIIANDHISVARSLLDMEEVSNSSDLSENKMDTNIFTREQYNILRSEATTPISRAMTPLTSALNKNIHNAQSLSSALGPELLKCEPKVLGDIHMTSTDIADLFQEYAIKYHQFLPVVDLSIGAENIYNLSPSLFWVILLIGLRHKHDSIQLMRRLATLVKSVLAEITIAPIIRYNPTDKDKPLLNVASVYSVQAFLIYTFWPPLTSSLSADTSWNTIGTAMFQAIRVGLNSADFSNDYASANPLLINEQVRTWVACNIVSQIVAASFGFPAYVSFDHAMINSTENHILLATDRGLEPELRQMAKIIHFQSQLQSTLNANPNDEIGLVDLQEKLPLIRVLGKQLNQLEQDLQEEGLDDIRHFMLLVARVHLLSYYFLTVEEQIDFESKRGLVRVYNASVSLLEFANEMCIKDPNIIKYFPGVFVLNVWQSACIVSKLVYSSLNGILDTERGSITYRNAVELATNASIIEYDMAHRFSGIMRSMWSMFKNIFEEAKTKAESNGVAGDFNLSITVRSRMAVSIFFDCLYVLKQKCGTAKMQRKRFDQRSAVGIDGHDTNPEARARMIIKTIPLDPSPINADTGTEQGSELTYPNSRTSTSILSLEAILNNSATEKSRTPQSEASSVVKKASGGETPPDNNVPVVSNFLNRPSLKESSSDLLSNNYENWQSDTVWKDVDLLLNDFAFNPTL